MKQNARKDSDRRGSSSHGRSARTARLSRETGAAGASLLFAAPALAAAPAPIRLMTGAEPASMQSGGAAGMIEQGGAASWGAWGVWWLAVVACAAMLALGVAILFHEVARLRAESDEERAFRLMARRMGLRKREQSCLGRLSDAAGIPAAALLLSAHAFEAALQAAGEGADLSDEAAAEIRRRVFGEQVAVSSGWPAGVVERIRTLFRRYAHARG